MLQSHMIIGSLRRFVLNTHRFEEQKRRPEVQAAFEDISQDGIERTLAKLKGQVYITPPEVQIKIDAAKKLLDESCKFEGIGNIADEIYLACKKNKIGKKQVDSLDLPSGAKILTKLIIGQAEIVEKTSISDSSNPALDYIAHELHKYIRDLALRLDPETFTIKKR